MTKANDNFVHCVTPLLKICEKLFVYGILLFATIFFLSNICQELRKKLP